MKQLFRSSYFDHMTLPKGILLLFVFAIGIVFGTGVYMLAQVLIAPALRDVPQPAQFIAIQALSIIVGFLVACGDIWLFLGYEDSMASVEAYKLEKYGEPGDELVDGRPVERKQGREDWYIRGLAWLLIVADLAALGNRLLYTPDDSKFYVGVFGLVCTALPWCAGKLYHILGQRPRAHRLDRLTAQVKETAMKDIETTIPTLPLAYRLRISRGEDIETVYQDYVNDRETGHVPAIDRKKVKALPTGANDQSA